MKIKNIILLITLLFVSYLSAEIVATVNGIEITEEMLSSKMQTYKNSTSSLAEQKKLALQDLINEALLLNYANQQGITIDQVELDAFFFSQLGDHPRFMVDGAFSKAKYESFRYTSRGKKILEEMRKELLLSKVKELLINDFNLTDAYLYQKYLIENRNIEINYALIDIPNVNIPLHYTYEGAKQYYIEHKTEILDDEKINIKFYYLPFQDYFIEAKNILSADSTAIDSLDYLIKKETINLAYKKAENLLSRLQNNQMVTQPHFTTGLISKNENFGIFTNDFLEKAFSEKPENFSDITQLENGLIIYSVAEYQEPKPAEMNDIKHKIWSAYTKDEDVKNQQQIENIFIANIDKFITPATVVQKIYLDKPSLFSSKSVKEHHQDRLNAIRKIIDNETKLREYIKKTNLKTESVVIYHSDLGNIDPVNMQIRKSITQGKNSGVIKSDDVVIVFKSHLFFPEFIPDISDVLPQLQELLIEREFSDVELLEYYEAHKKDFVTPDSLQLAICFFEKDYSNIKIPEKDLISYYNEHSIFKERSVNFDYIYSGNIQRANLISDYTMQISNFNLIKLLFSEKCNLKNGLVEYSKLPAIISENLDKINSNSISKPIAFKNGWIVLKKINEYPAGKPTFAQMKIEILHKLQTNIAEKNAYLKARAVFDSTRYFSQVYQYADSKNIYKTPLQNANDNFEIIGNIFDHRKELMRIWKNEKYSKIIETDDGFAVIYMLKRVSSKQLDFNSAKSKIKQLLIAQEQISQAKRYVENIAEKIKNGADPKRLLYFISTWEHAKINRLDNDIFSSKYSKTIIKDISKHEEGYFSPVIKLEDERFLLYQISQMEVLDKASFMQNREDYKETVIKEMMQNWFNRQASLAEIVKY
jgi:Cu/Ag efflux protein CusF